MPDWGVSQCSFNMFNYWWNRTFTVFLNTYNFPIFKIWKRKTVWVVLVFDGFSTSRFFFSLFLRVSYILPELAEISILFQCWIYPNLRFYSFYEWAIFSRSWLNSASCSNAGFVQTKDSPSNFSNAYWPFWCEDSVDQLFHFSSSITSPNHATRLTLTSFVSAG